MNEVSRDAILNLAKADLALGRDPTALIQLAFSDVTGDGTEEEDEPLFPRRRDVREMVEDVLHALLANSDEDGEFDQDFLTDVRDLMREGVPFLDAVGAFAPNFDEDLSDLFPVSSLYWP